MSKNSILYWMIPLSAVLFIGFSLLDFIALHLISIEVRDACSEAQREYAEDCVAALSQYAKSADYSYKQRNRAIWALGEIGDNRAIPVLKSLARNELQTERYNTSLELCEYGVTKSIRLCEKLNIVRYVWHWI